MKFTFGSSKKGDVAEALSGISEPAALFFSVAGEEMLEHAATEIEKRFPGVACIGGVGQAYIDKQFFDQGITVTAMRGEIKVVADVLEQASVMPIKYIRRLENAVKAVGGEREGRHVSISARRAVMSARSQPCQIISAVRDTILRVVRAIRLRLHVMAKCIRTHVRFYVSQSQRKD